MLVPGSGEPNFDSYVADPYQRSRARKEQEVHQLMDKLQPDMIVLDPSTIGQVCIVCCSRSAVFVAVAVLCLLRTLCAATDYSAWHKEGKRLVMSNPKSQTCY